MLFPLGSSSFCESLRSRDCSFGDLHLWWGDWTQPRFVAAWDAEMAAIGTAKNIKQRQQSDGGKHQFNGCKESSHSISCWNAQNCPACCGVATCQGNHTKQTRMKNMMMKHELHLPPFPFTLRVVSWPITCSRGHVPFIQARKEKHVIKSYDCLGIGVFQPQVQSMFVSAPNTVKLHGFMCMVHRDLHPQMAKPFYIHWCNIMWYQPSYLPVILKE